MTRNVISVCKSKVRKSDGNLLRSVGSEHDVDGIN